VRHQLGGMRRNPRSIASTAAKYADPTAGASAADTAMANCELVTGGSLPASASLPHALATFALSWVLARRCGRRDPGLRDQELADMQRQCESRAARLSAALAELDGGSGEARLMPGEKYMRGVGDMDDAGYDEYRSEARAVLSELRDAFATIARITGEVLTRDTASTLRARSRKTRAG
jgi:hypothetical protein